MTLQDHPDVVLLLGPPGAGKGTQAKLLAEALNLPHVASGDLLREHRQQGTELGKQAQSYMDSGKLVPDDLVVSMIMDRLDQPDAQAGVLLDGFPRTATQAVALADRLLDRSGAVRAALYLHVPEEILVDRLSGRLACPDCQSTFNERLHKLAPGEPCPNCGGTLQQRSDDRRDVVQERVRVYLTQTIPVIDHYAALGILRRINGDRPVQEVFDDLRASVARAEV